MAISEYVLPVDFLEETGEVLVKLSDRRSLSVEIGRRGEAVVRAPRGVSRIRILWFLKQRRQWIDEHIRKMRTRLTGSRDSSAAGLAPVFTDAEMRAMHQAAKKDLTERIRYYAPLVGVTVNKIYIRAQKSRFGSCSTNGNISLNQVLVCLPEELRNYVVVHELCHRREMNHSPRFWAEVARVFPDYQRARKELKEKGAPLIARLP